MTLKEWRLARKKIKEKDRDAEPTTLAPPEAFDDRRPDDAFRRRFHPRHDPEEVGPHSRAVRGRLGSSCAGWVESPSSKEFYEAVRTATPTQRHREIIKTWLGEATREEMLEAWAEGAYTWRQLARAIHRAGVAKSYRCCDINTLAR